jgi:hypothetical protein
MQSRVVLLVVALLAVSAITANAQTTPCSTKGGVCSAVGLSTCSTGFKTGMCASDKSVQCCIGKVTVKTPAAPVVDTAAPVVVGPPVIPVIPAFNPMTLIPASPLWAQFQGCYPVGPARLVKARLGGDAAKAKGINAMRISATFNCVAKLAKIAKYNVPVIAGKGANAVSAAKENLALNTEDFYKQVAIKVLGKPTLTMASLGVRGVDASSFSAKRGVIYFDWDYAGSWSNQQGSFDLWDGTGVVSAPGDANALARNFALAKSVHFWAL